MICGVSLTLEKPTGNWQPFHRLDKELTRNPMKATHKGEAPLALEGENGI